MNATQIYERLVQESFIPATVSVDSVQRFIRHNDLNSARDPNLRDRLRKNGRCILMFNSFYGLSFNPFDKQLCAILGGSR